jgi:hypothetical protein
MCLQYIFDLQTIDYTLNVHLYIMNVNTYIDTLGQDRTVGLGIHQSHDSKPNQEQLQVDLVLIGELGALQTYNIIIIICSIMGAKGSCVIEVS